MLGKEQVPAHDEIIDPTTEDRKAVLLSRATNNQVYTDLILSCMDEISFSTVDEAKTKELPDGNAELAWKNLVAKYKPTTCTTKTKLKHEFTHSSLDNTKKDPDK